MLRPFLLIGVGGSGGKTLRGIKYQLELKLQQLGWEGGIPAAWRFLHFDTPTVQDGMEYQAPFLPRQDYRGLVSTAATFDIVHGSITSAHATNNAMRHDIERQLPDPRLVKVDVTKGAGQYRAVGRAVALAATKEIAQAARLAIGRMNDAESLAELQTLGQRLRARVDGGDGSPIVIVISSVAGGSGAGQFLDIIEIIKSTAKQYPWSNQFFSMLYAPDVFDQLSVTAGMPGNALAAISETMNGFWTDTPSPATLELLRTKGVAPSYGAAMDRVGAAYPFIVGRSNSKVTFEDQNAVYDAVATSLTAWMIDERVQDDMIAYSSGNWQARSAANVLPDNSGLMSPAHHSPPFSSIGFGRVTLGRERFLEYSAERFARSAIDRMLFAHAEEDPQFERMTEREYIEKSADSEYQRFLRELRLNEETAEHNDVTDALRDQSTLDLIKAELQRGADDELARPESLDRQGGTDITTWTDRLVNEFTRHSPRLLQRDREARQRRLDEWTRTMPGHILETVSRYVAQDGLPVVTAMLRRLERGLKGTVDALRVEARQHEEWVGTLSSLVSDELRTSANQQSIRPDQEAVQFAIQRLGQALEWSSEAALRDSAWALLAELRETFLGPLADYLDGSRTALLQRVHSRKTSDDRENAYEFWPRRVDETVPRKYSPAPNERMLVEPEKYPAEFQKLVRASVDGDAKYQDAVLRVLADQLVGVSPDSESDAGAWSLVGNPRTWKPTVTADPAVANPAQRASFELATDPEVYVGRARAWMKRDGTPFAAYIGEDLLGFFDSEVLPPDVFAARRDRYREQLQAALGASEPLVKLNPALLRAVHGKAINEDTSLVFSSIPFRAGTEMYEVTKGVLGQMGVWDDATSESWFQDQKVDGIEVFAMSGFPYEPIVMDSVMEPIARGWLAQSNTQDSREAFWKFKRARLLGESIPADPRAIESMIRGWYVAKALGRLAVDASQGEKGPKLSVWDPSTRALADFPHPLLSERNARPADFPGVVLQSLAIAMALCNVDGTLAPLAAYRVLTSLGGSRGEETELAEWLQTGALPTGAPVPESSRAGSADGDLASRRSAVQAYLTAELARFDSDIVQQDDMVSVYDYPVTWEMREQFREALLGLVSSVVSTGPRDSGV
ncbi:tubulin-like doman-containing protein [Rathayibacter sp. VKM Ac-2928]|uniref:tubulin-like doman-containing protein n=1 Tax=Rathayibacter sp. VKM Ac-2928 TaxID=2929479 RepID=UPI001FB438B0|nr:tubulin-like doman-containing protein [Rathayibacter sp. VKM Ac-2928]MCJ1683980.1 tubulin-like doman-containing protein [Rathayibacter sp. VKM Ac-2928]